MRRIAVVEAGPRTTVEDLGRSGAARFGIPPGGAFDAVALVAANRLVGNPDGAAGLEFTLRGPRLRNAGDERLHVVLVGADFGATIAGAEGSRALALGQAYLLEPGEELRTGQAHVAARGWLAVGGGIAVPPRLGSRSTCLAAALGGLSGRALRPCDVLPVGVPACPPLAVRWLERTPRRDGAVVALRMLPGPQADRFSACPLSALEATLWRVAVDSDRVGVRLEPLDPAAGARLGGLAGISPEGTTLGAIQVPPDGRPIILGPDRPVTGGYAKPALVIQADLGRLASLRPGDRVRFARVSLERARGLARDRLASLPPPASEGGP